MRSVLAGSLALLAGCALSVAPSEQGEGGDEVQAGLSALVYGADDRQEYGQASARHRGWADSVAMLVYKDQVACSGATCTLARRDWTIDFVSDKRLCSSVRYRAQKTLAFGGLPPLGGFCTGFLVGPDLVASAAHCLHSGHNHINTRFVFGYQADANGGSIPTTVPQSNVYSAVAAYEHFLFTDPNWDWIVYKLDRPVANRYPLPIRRTGQVENGTPLVIIGHPNGLPLKVSPTGTVRQVSDPYMFGHNVESFKANSGSPVLDARTGVVEGIEVLAAPGIVQFKDATDAKGPCVTETLCSMTSGCPGYSRSWRVSAITEYVPLTPSQIFNVLNPT